MSALTVAVNPAVSSMPSRLNVLKPGQREGHGIGAGPQIDDVVAALAVGDDGPDLFDQRRAGGFHRHAGQHRARRVSHDARDAARGGGLCRRARRRKPHAQDHGPRFHRRGARVPLRPPGEEKRVWGSSAQGTRGEYQLRRGCCQANTPIFLQRYRVAGPVVSGTSIRIMPSCREVRKSSPSRLRLMCRSARVTVAPLVASISSRNETYVRFPPRRA